MEQVYNKIWVNYGERFGNNITEYVITYVPNINDYIFMKDFVKRMNSYFCNYKLQFDTSSEELNNWIVK